MMMIKSIKNSIWNCIKDKEVALFMIFSDEGEILWHQGREVKGRHIHDGKGFCRSYCLEALKKQREIAKEDCLINLNGHCFSESALILKIKQLMIFPVSKELFFYLDSGSSESFLEKEILELKTWGKVFSQLIEEIKGDEKGAQGITGKSDAVIRIRTLVRKYSIVEEPVLLLGETGVGKNHVAELIHNYSGKEGNFVSVHTPGVAEDLFESQLFGHCKGSFTGASSDTTGFVARAAGGTLFLDEIAELSQDIQAKLLRLIDKKSYTRLGDSLERQADVRIIAATNKDLRELIANKLFRADLYFRLNVLPILIPPLRERREDIPDLLAENAGLLRNKKLAPAAIGVLVDYPWPGNIRELRSVLTRAGIDYESDEIGAEITEFFEKDIAPPVGPPGNSKLERIWLDLKGGGTFWEVVKKPFLHRELNRDEVRAILSQGLNECGRKYKNVAKLFNLEDGEYHSFMSFLNENDLNKNS
jgi:DNA-binding NtrC family response regulator